MVSHICQTCAIYIKFYTVWRSDPEIIEMWESKNGMKHDKHSMFLLLSDLKYQVPFNFTLFIYFWTFGSTPFARCLHGFQILRLLTFEAFHVHNCLSLLVGKAGLAE